MKILFCNYEYPPLGGGGGVFNAQIAEELAGQHEVTVLTSQGLGLPKQSREKGVRIIRTPVYFRKRNATANLTSMLAFIPRGILTGLKLLKEERFDVMNTQFVLPSGPVGDYLAHHAGIPNILSVHGGDLYDPSKFTSPHRHALLRAWVRRLLLRADAVIGGSHNTLDNVHKYYAPELQGLHIPLGIPRAPCYETSRKDFGFTDEQVLLITVGRLVPRKAVPQLIEMVSQIENPNLHLIVVGSGPEDGQLKALARRLGVESRVHMMGFVEECDKYRLLQISDIYVSTSQHEGFCLSNMEGMRSGMPLITYDYGGHTDYLKDGQTGFVVPLNNRELFRSRITQLIDSPDLRSQMRQYNLKAIEEYYVDNTAARYANVFSSAVEQYAKNQPKSQLRSRTVSMD